MKKIVLSLLAACYILTAQAQFVIDKQSRMALNTYTDTSYSVRSKIAYYARINCVLCQNKLYN